ncbi:MAG: cupin domain-containing protein [Aestuariivirga sp.]
MSRKSIPDLVSGGWHKLAFEQFRQGIEVHWIIKGGAADPSVAVLKYEAGSAVPRHRHAGLETIVVLDGVQSDESGDYAAGIVVLNEVGSEHSVWSKEGCVVLIQWNLPVIILGEAK